MRSAFFGLNIAQQGLYTAQTNLNITSHNIANADTEGYSRQYSVQSATKALSFGERGMVGTGSEITNVLQYRDDYLDDKYWDVVNELGEFEVKDELLNQMEIIFNEPSDIGYSTYFNDIFTSMNDLAKDPSDPTTRSAFIDTMESFALYLNDVGEQLTQIQEDANFGVSTVVDQINYHSQQLATLNHQIGNLELSGNVANDLRDERNRLIDSLSKIINIQAEEYTDINGKSTYKVTIDGQVLVNDTEANYLEIKARDTLNNPEDSVDMYDIYWETGHELYINNSSLSGELKGYIDIRDGNNGENFTGEIESGEGTSTIVMRNPSRTDIPQVGELNIGGALMRYNSYSYDSVNDEITFDLGAPLSVDGQSAYGTDIYGDSFTGTITRNSAEQVVITNPLDQDLDPSGGVISLDGISVTYTGYTKDPVTYEITLDIQAPADANDESTWIGDDQSFKGIPYYLDQLNEFVRTLAVEFNAINESGNGDTGVPLFTFEGYTGTELDTTDSTTYELMDIHNFTVNAAVLEDTSLIETAADPNAGESANDLIMALIDLRHDDDMFAKGEPENFLQSVIGELGIDAKQVNSMMKGQEDMVTLVNNQRLSVSGVDINEETTNLLKFQQAYEVAAQIISVMDEIYDTTINGMGVG